MLDVVARTPIEQVIESSGLHLLGRGRYRRTQEHDSLIVDTHANLFNWNSRDLHGDAVTWLTEVCHLTFQEAKAQLEDGRFGAALPAPVQQVRRRVLTTPPPLNLELARSLHHRMSPAGRTWWQNEGLPDAVIDRYLLGEYHHPRYGLCYTLPVIEQDATGEPQLVNLRMRLAEPVEYGKYRPWDHGRGTQLFNRDVLRSAPQGIVVVAGEKKALVLAGYGIEAVSPTGGCGNWLPEWTSILKAVPHRWVAYDPNEIEAGRKIAQLLAARLALFPDKPDDFILAYGKRAFVSVLWEAV